MPVSVQAIRFKQWLPEWTDFSFDEDDRRKKPSEHALLFSMPAVQLRALSGVYRRQRDESGGEGLQRKHDPKRSETIRDFVRFGHPYSSLHESQRNEDADALRKPGWLPTAIVVNILPRGAARRDRSLADGDVVEVQQISETEARLILPYEDPLTQWSPSDLEPFEVIDGQHRLWAFEEALENGSLPGDFELPVVAFTDLDIGWQAYLFWSINVSPKRINPSHAFDLFPLLRSQEWLQTLSELRIYREARAQELTELLFTHEQSPWHDRINMLGETARSAPKGARVTQAGWVRAFLGTYLNPAKSAHSLFSADVSELAGPLEWSRPQQAAFLILLWRELKTAVLGEPHDWAEKLTRGNGQDQLLENELAFSGAKTMLNQEKGVRGVLGATNDLFFEMARRDIKLFRWSSSVTSGGPTSTDDVTVALEELQGRELAAIIREVATSFASFDWRSADAPALDDATKLMKRAFRGSGGYVALRDELMKHLAAGDGRASDVARGVLHAQKV